MCKRRQEGEKKNLLTADFSTSDRLRVCACVGVCACRRGVAVEGGRYSLVFLQRRHREASCAAGTESAERKMVAEVWREG